MTNVKMQSLPAPVVTPLVEAGTISSSTPSVTVTVPASANTQSGDVLYLWWSQDYNGFEELDYLPVTASIAGRALNFTVGQDAYAAASSVALYYIVLRDSNSFQSDVLSLKIDKAPRGLPAPEVPQAIAGEIDIDGEPVAIIVPKNILNTGERVRGITGNILTDEVIVAEEDSPLVLTASSQQMLILSGQGERNWGYEVYFKGGWYESEKIKISVLGPLSFGDTAILETSGYYIAEGIVPLNPPNDATYTRSATGGYPPYTYSVEDSSIAHITQDGKVTAMGNGTTSVKVTDNRGNIASHMVVVSNVNVLINYGKGKKTYNEIVNLCAELNCNFPKLSTLKSLWSLYHKQGNKVADLLGWESDDSSTAKYLSADKDGTIYAWAYNFNGSDVNGNASRINRTVALYAVLEKK